MKKKIICFITIVSFLLLPNAAFAVDLDDPIDPNFIVIIPYSIK